MKTGHIKILLDQRWDFREFSELPKYYIQLYSIFYFLQTRPIIINPEKIPYIFSKFPWRGGYSVVNFYSEIYYQIPPDYRPQISSIQYNSPGHIELYEISQTSFQITGIAILISASILLNILYKNFIE